MGNKMKKRVVLDTNVLLVSVSSFSKYHWIYLLIIEKKIELFITNEILSEYFEILSFKFDIKTAKSVVRTLLELDNVNQLQVFFNFNLIVNDPDDNKFVDCAISGNADYLVTNDRDFNVLKDVKFPKVNVVNIDEFEKEIK
jgi:putative PIN family toxin of toxin-antitoxin system